ncbi:MAG: ROK family protein, partial [Bryobacteraceae bacterium]
MGKGIGVLVADRITAAVIVDHKVVGPIRSFPEDPAISDALIGIPAELIAARVVDEVKQLAGAEGAEYLGVGFPGIIRNNIIEDSPNLQQLKGSW